MKVDIEYFSKLLDVFIDAETAHIYVDDIQKAGIDVISEDDFNQKFLFHIQLALDKNIIGARYDAVETIEDIGLEEYAGGSVGIVPIPIRLTQDGHDFATALQHKEVISKIKSEFKEYPFSVIFDGSKKIMQHLDKKKIDQFFGADS